MDNEYRNLNSPIISSQKGLLSIAYPCLQSTLARQLMPSYPIIENLYIVNRLMVNKVPPTGLVDNDRLVKVNTASTKAVITLG